jgi:hypothetical protein
MKKNKSMILLLFGLMVGIIFLPDVVLATTTSNGKGNGLPAAWDADSHNKLLTQAQELKNFIFSTPIVIGGIFAFAMAIYHAFREGSVMPLLTMIGIIILASLVPTILDILTPIHASGMVLPN